MMRRVIQGAVRGAFERVLDYLHVGTGTPYYNAILSAMRTATSSGGNPESATIHELIIQGDIGYCHHSTARASAASTFISGDFGRAQNDSTGLVGTACGQQGQVLLTNSGHVTNAAALVAESPFISGSGRPVNNIGLWVKEQLVSGAAESWGIACESTSPSFHIGQLRIGSVPNDGSGAILQLTGKANASDGYQLAGGATITTGSGSPEGAVTATPGSIYCRTSGTVWRKASGSGNTGWVDMGAADPAFFAVNPTVPSTTIDWANGKAQKVDLLSLSTGPFDMLAPTGSTDGLEVMLMLVPRGFTVTWNAAWKLPTWAEVDPSAGTYTMARFKYDGSTLRLISFLTGLTL
jgi:hypothetical protein